MASTGEVGVVAIGRNEGARLERCLESARKSTARVVYVDSGSHDDSVAFAKSIGVAVVNLDTSVAFTAARARNAGIDHLVELYPDLAHFQVVDGDCELREDWLGAAHDYLLAHDRVGVVFGRRRERDPSASVYNHLCDIEWDSPIGEARACGGDALFRRQAFEEAGRYNPAFIAGEEPELCVRIRARGWTVMRIDHEMTLHDAAMTTFGQFWQRSKRAGHAYAQGASAHGGPPERHGVRQVLSALFWGLCLPVVSAAAAVPTLGLSLVAYAAVWFLQSCRIARRLARSGRSRSDARLMARFTMLAKFPQASGVLLFWWRRLTGQVPTLIEYKG